MALLGGHTVQDQEIKFGYAVTGDVDPARFWANGGAQPGDALFLTKAFGTGIVATALKFGRAPADTAEAAVQSMLVLNRAACEALQTSARRRGARVHRHHRLRPGRAGAEMAARQRLHDW